MLTSEYYRTNSDLTPSQLWWHRGCSLLLSMWNAIFKMRPLRRAWYIAQIFVPFLGAFFSRNGLFSAEGRLLILGKARRSFLSLFPPFARSLQKKYGLVGGCQSCGASCKLMFQCPHWDDKSHLCSIYEDRPNICRLFPMTPSDIRDRNIVLKKQTCGFEFRKPNPLPAPSQGKPILVPVKLRSPKE